jgi:hypothetical protein
MNEPVEDLTHLQRAGSLSFLLQSQSPAEDIDEGVYRVAVLACYPSRRDLYSIHGHALPCDPSQIVGEEIGSLGRRLLGIQDLGRNYPYGDPDKQGKVEQ